MSSLDKKKELARQYKEYYKIPALVENRSRPVLAAKLLSRIRLARNGVMELAIPHWQQGAKEPPPLPPPSPADVAFLEGMRVVDLIALGQSFNDYYNMGNIKTANAAVLKAMVQGKIDEGFVADVAPPFHFGDGALAPAAAPAQKPPEPPEPPRAVPAELAMAAPMAQAMAPPVPEPAPPKPKGPPPEPWKNMRSAPDAAWDKTWLDYYWPERAPTASLKKMKYAERQAVLSKDGEFISSLPDWALQDTTQDARWRELNRAGLIEEKPQGPPVRLSAELDEDEDERWFREQAQAEADKEEAAAAAKEAKRPRHPATLERLGFASRLVKPLYSPPAGTGEAGGPPWFPPEGLNVLTPVHYKGHEFLVTQWGDMYYPRGSGAEFFGVWEWKRQRVLETDVPDYTNELLVLAKAPVPLELLMPKKYAPAEPLGTLGVKIPTVDGHRVWDRPSVKDVPQAKGT